MKCKLFDLVSDAVNGSSVIGGDMGDSMIANTNPMRDLLPKVEQKINNCGDVTKTIPACIDTFGSKKTLYDVGILVLTIKLNTVPLESE
jgi:hypothetical protein